MATDSDHAMFVDIMGFAGAIAELTDAEHALLTDALQGDRFIRPDGDSPKVFKVWRSYGFFHSKLQELLAHHRGGAIATAAVFSDSAFVVAPAIATVGRLAKAIMNSCYEQRIPIRIGIGFGGYARLAFSTRALPSGLLITESPFLGSAIVRAYAAQEKAPGFRIFIHPSAAQQLQTRWLYVDLPAAERTASRVQEINFLDMRRNPDLPEPVDWDADLAAMRNGVTDSRAVQHYEAWARRSEIRPFAARKLGHLRA